MKEIKKYLVDGSDYLLSYSKMTGKKVRDIEGYVTDEFGDCTFKLCTIVFEDGSSQSVEGEHDLPYLIDYDDKIIKLMDRLYKEENEGEE